MCGLFECLISITFTGINCVSWFVLFIESGEKGNEFFPYEVQHNFVLLYTKSMLENKNIVLNSFNAPITH